MGRGGRVEGGGGREVGGDGWTELSAGRRDFIFVTVLKYEEENKLSCSDMHDWSYVTPG